MAQFPLNLDDGERWLPSGIFFPQVFPYESTPHSSPLDLASSMDDIASRVLLQLHHRILSQHRPPSFPLNLEETIRVPIRCGPSFPLPEEEPPLSVNGGLCVDPCKFRAYGTTRTCSASSGPVFEHPFLNRPHPQVEACLETRGRVLQRQQQQNRVQTGLILPYRGLNERAAASGPVKGSVGTGVFLPRAAATTASAVTASRKKHGGSRRSSRQESSDSTGKRSWIARAGVGKKQECHCQQLSPEMALPQDWTY